MPVVEDLQVFFLHLKFIDGVAVTVEQLLVTIGVLLVSVVYFFCLGSEETVDEHLLFLSVF